jgi:hypothetical protein
VIASREKKCRTGKDFTFSEPSNGGLRQRLGSERTKMHFPLVSRCRIGFWSGTLPLVKSQNATALALRGVLPSSLVALVTVGGELKQMQATIPPFRSGPIGSETNTMAAAQTTTPNPSIEGMPKRLRLSCTPHVKR